MEIEYHRAVQKDLNDALRHYDEVSRTLGSDFYSEFMAGIEIVIGNPKICHFDSSGLRRCNLEKFPYHFLYDIRFGRIRIWVLRHEKRKPSFGAKRFGYPLK